MLSKLCPRPTYANVMSSIAVFLAMVGTTYAFTLPRNSVGTKHIKTGAVTGSDIRKNAVTSPKVRDSSLLAKDFRSGELPAGAPGAPGPQGATGQPGATGPQGEPGSTADLSSPGTINTASNPVDWTKLKSVPGGIADGDDNVNGGDASLFDGLDSLQFLRGDTADTFSGSLFSITNDLDVEGVGRFDEIQSDPTGSLDVSADSTVRIFIDANNNQTNAVFSVFTCVDSGGSCLTKELLRVEEDGSVLADGTFTSNGL